MATHLAAWFESLDHAALGRINTVQDDVLTPSGDDRFLVPEEYNYLHWAMATGLNLSGARIVTPSLEVMKSDLDVIPFRDGADLPDTSNPAIWVPNRKIALAPSEAIEFQTSEDGSSATTTQGFVALGTRENEPMPEGEIRSVRATGTTTLTADVWTTVTLTLESSLEEGVYALVHFVPLGVSVVAARFLPQGGGYRPGMFGMSGASPLHFNYNPEMWHRLGWFKMLEFTHITVPQIQFWATAGDTAQVVQMYVVRLRSTRSGG